MIRLNTDDYELTILEGQIVGVFKDINNSELTVFTNTGSFCLEMGCKLTWALYDYIVKILDDREKKDD